MQMDNSKSRWSLENGNPYRHGRHYYITRVSCVPNEKNLPPIDGFQRSSDSSLPEFATWDDRKNNRKLFSNRSHPLAEGQILESTGMSFHSDKHKCTFHQNILLKVISSHLVLSRLSQLWSSATVSFKHKCRVENLECVPRPLEWVFRQSYQRAHVRAQFRFPPDQRHWSTCGTAHG